MQDGKMPMAVWLNMRPLFKDKDSAIKMRDDGRYVYTQLVIDDEDCLAFGVHDRADALYWEFDWYIGDFVQLFTMDAELDITP